MEKFLNEDFLLRSDTAKEIYHSHVENLPIIDYHCHVSPKEIYENKSFKNISELWLSGDHYKWRLMRSNGVSEEYITGNKSDKEKFLKFAELMPLAIGNPMYHWCHLELKRYFGFEGVLNEDSAEEVWELCERVLSEGGMSVRDIIKKSNVKFIGTTDDPTDDLKYHRLLREEKDFDTVVAPSFRPDKAFALSSDTYPQYAEALSKCSGVEINSLSSLKAALKNRIDYFDEMGCRASDHGLNYVAFEKMSEAELDEAIRKAVKGDAVSKKEIDALVTEMLVFLAEEYGRRRWVMQLHFNCIRNPNSEMFSKIGADTGFDIIGPNNGSLALVKLLDEMYKNNMPKIILYSLDPSDNAFIDTLIGAFQSSGYQGSLQHGSAWWFNDTMDGMISQMKSLASLSLFGNFVGMLTDSRSFLSYTRHEYFRRILSNFLADFAERGEYPSDIKTLGVIAERVSYYNAKNYFSL